MREIPDCLNRRYKALNDLIEDITNAMPGCMGGPGGCGSDGCSSSGGGTGGECSSSAMAPPCGENIDEESEVGIKLMCDFWKILQDDPDFNLTQAVQQRMCIETCTGKCNIANLEKKPCCAPSSTGGGVSARSGGSASASSRGSSGGCGKKVKPTSSRLSTRRPKVHDCGLPKREKDVPLRKVLGSLKQAASYEKKCTSRVSDLISAQKDLREQIINLEEKEKKGVVLMKQADCMWSCMEDAYKNKIAASQERYQRLQKELREVEASVSKWRKNKKDLEFQIKNVNKCSQDLNEKTIQKENDIKVMELEIEGFKTRIASNAKDLNAAKNSYASKKNASDARLAKIAEEMEKFKNKIGYECKCKTDKENEGSNFVKEAREELQKTCRGLLQKKLENEDLRAEKEALLQEIALLKNTYDTCAERCARRENNIAEETKRIDNEISGFSAKCVKCNKTTDSTGVLGCCVDCPRCSIERDCLTDGDHCNADHTNECVCTRVKEKFLDNVFENMYTVLERQVKTCSGKEMADCIFTCLKRSRNGKLDQATRKILQQFILSTVKQNLNLTIVGGAVKTRCEMDPDTYSQLMLCLKDVAVTSPVKEDKATVSKKPPCNHWDSNGECNCPQGPKSCPCSKKAPKPPTYPGTCGHIDTEEDRVVESSVKICPKMETAACGVDCGMLGLPGAVEWKREPCAGRTCPFGANMRAAQCVLGPEALADVRTAPPSPPPVRATPPTPPVVPCLPPCHSPCQKATCISGSKAVKSCHTATKQVKGDVKDNLNKGTTANYQTATNENFQLTLSLSDAASAKVSLKPISSLQKAILCTDEQQEKILDQLIKNNLNQNDTKERFQIIFKNKNGQSTNRQFTELTQTPSGKLAIELDEQTIKIIEEESFTDPYLCMSIKTSSSGHVLVDFDTKENVTDNSHRVTVRRTPSGTKLLDIHKHMIRNLKDILSKKISNAGVSRSIKFPLTPKRSESPIDVDTEVPQLLMSDKDLIFKGSMGTTYSDPDLSLKYITGPTTTDHLEHISGPILTEIYMKNKKKKDQKCTCPKTTLESDSTKLKSDTGLMPKNKKKDILACSCNKSNSSSVSCRITRELDSPQELLISTWKSSTSRSVDKNYASELQQLYLQGNANVAVQIEVKNGMFQKLPAVITKNISGTIAIYARGMSSLQGIGFDGKECPVLLSKTVSGTYFVRIGSDYQNFNATLIKTSSKGILLIPQSFQERHRNGHEDIFLVKLCVMRNQLFEIPAVLKPTASNNYIVVLDKEFETCYKESLKEYFGDNLEGCVNLHTTNSGNYVLDFGSQDKSHIGEKSALLVQTSSGHIKVLVRGPEFEALVQKKLSIHSTSSAHASAQINSKLSTSSREFHSENARKSKNLEKQSCSKTQSFGKMKQKFQDNLPLPSEPSTVVKKTPSGQYAVLLNEESKRSLLNNLQNNSLISNTEGLVSIKQLDSGEIIIFLSNKDERKAHHGTLKVTPSGHFYVLVDKEVMKDLTGSSIKNERSYSAIGKRSKHAAQLIDSVHKSVATTFQAKLDVCNCEPSKCVCVDRLLDTTDGSNDKLSQLCPCVWKDMSAGGVPIPSTSKDESSCDERRRKDEFESTEQCFCWLDSSHPPNNRFVDLSNKLKRKSVVCQAHKKELEKKIKLEGNTEDPAGQDVGKVWDSLDYLPPQLPHFLKDVRYR